MKKIITLFAIAVAVVSARAASVDWSVSGTSDQANTTVYLLTCVPGDYENAEALAAAAVSSAAITSAGRGKYSTPTTRVNDNSITANADFYYAIVASDGKSYTYLAATGMGNKVYDPDAQEASKGTFNSISASAILAGTEKSFGTPEPTSGLLLLVGGALLALRRKQK